MLLVLSPEKELLVAETANSIVFAGATTKVYPKWYVHDFLLFIRPLAMKVFAEYIGFTPPVCPSVHIWYKRALAYMYQGTLCDVLLPELISSSWKISIATIAETFNILSVNFPHKDYWRGALMFSLIYAWKNGWTDSRDAGDLRRHHAHYDVTVTSK